MKSSIKRDLIIVGFIILFTLSASLILGYPVLDSGISESLNEDQYPEYTYNFTQNITGSITGNLVFSIEEIKSESYSFENVSDYFWVTIDPSTGVLTFNSTRDNETGYFNVSIQVIDSSFQGTIVASYFNVSPVNDAPYFLNLENQTFNATELFEYEVNVSDEENDTPYNLTIDFLECSTVEWSDRNSTDCNLFNSSDYSFNETTGILNISFTPVRNDVGSYIMNISVTDDNDLGNQTTSQLVNFTVSNINMLPYFTYICDNERNGSENSEFACWINASDIDEVNNLTFETNYSWFTFNASNSTIVEVCNSSTEYNASVMINFTPTDLQVGNWSVNISITDTGGESGDPKMNSTEIWFFIDNIEDPVTLDSISPLSIYQNTTIYTNAYDDDLLVPDKSVKNEVLTFASNTSWVSIATDSSAENYTRAKIDIDFDTALASVGAGDYIVNLNVSDTADNSAEINLTITVGNDSIAVWDISNVFILNESEEFYINLSANVSDAEGDTITFSFTNDTEFPSFTLDSTTGEINFTPEDGDIGDHNITINASDGHLDSLMSFNFTVYNIYDNPHIQFPIEADGATVNSTTSNVNVSEDTATQIFVYAEDEDYRIPAGQKEFYNESLIINATIEGPNTTLLEFIADNSYPTSSFPNKTLFTATFTPGKADVGDYNISINISDVGGYSDFLQFNLTITSINHAPELFNLTNFTTSVNQSLYYQINASDVEDGSSETQGNFTFSYSFLSGGDIFNSSIFNSATGELNITFDSSQNGSYNINITVNDSEGAQDSSDFWIYVYDPPTIVSPDSSYEFSLVEGTESNLSFQALHSVGDNLTYEFYTENASGDDILRYTTSDYGNNTAVVWPFTPNYTDETYEEYRNLTLIAYPSNTELENRIDLNTTTNWNLMINHTNAPVNFSGFIGSAQASYDQTITINLAQYFSDEDYSDSNYNQTVSFAIISNSTVSYITATEANWALSLTSLVATKEILIINATDYDGNDSISSALSNSFEIEFTTPTTVATPVPSGGGGSRNPLVLKLILPDPLSAYKKESIKVPIVLSNEGKTGLIGINLTGRVAMNNTLRDDIAISFEKSYFSSLQAGEKQNTSMTIFVNSDEIGLYEITINATVSTPTFSDWGKIFLTVREANQTEVIQEIVFTEEFIAENPECIEIKEVIDEAKKLYDQKNYKDAMDKVQEALDSCKYAISQQALPRKTEAPRRNIYEYISFLFLAVILIAIVYFFYKRKSLRMQGG